MMNETWKIGKQPSVVVSDKKITNTNFPVPPNSRESADDEMKYYGGYIVCESIGNSEHAKLIAASLSLLKALQEIIELFPENPKLPISHQVLEIAQAAIKKATS